VHDSGPTSQDRIDAPADEAGKAFEASAAAEAEQPEDVTGLLHAARGGDREASEDLIRRVYAELHRLAERHLRRERSDHTLQPTALVHEAYLRLVHQRSARFRNRSQFFAVASQAMRRVLVDHARGRATSKRGGAVARVSLDAGPVGLESPDHGEPLLTDVDLLDLNRALGELAELDPGLVRVVELRFFGGLTIEEAAVAMELSPASIKRSWATARAWLYDRMSGGRPDSGGPGDDHRAGRP
jgi:RNA polymerase sigma factor (TIGR02999 family)